MLLLVGCCLSLSKHDWCYGWFSHIARRQMWQNVRSVTCEENRHFCHSGNIREFKKWRRQCHKSMIWLVEWGKIVVHALWCNFCDVGYRMTTWNYDFIFEALTTTKARRDKSFILYLTWKPFAPSKRKYSSPISNFLPMLKLSAIMWYIERGPKLRSSR